MAQLYQYISIGSDNIRKIKIITRDSGMAEQYNSEFAGNVAIDENNIIKLSNSLTNSYIMISLKRLLNSLRYYFNNSDFDAILQKINCLIVNDNRIYELIQNYCQKRLNIWIEENDTLNLEGFINFRMYECDKILVDIIINKLDSVITEIEYDKILKSISEYINNNSKCDLIEVVCVNSIKYDKINRDNLYFLNTSNIIISADNLIDYLLEKLPKKIIIHKYKLIKEFEIFKTLTKIFNEKMILCNSCEICKSIMD